MYKWHLLNNIPGEGKLMMVCFGICARWIGILEMQSQREVACTEPMREGFDFYFLHIYHCTY